MFPGAARLAEARGLRERARVSACFLAAHYTYVTRTCGAWSGCESDGGRERRGRGSGQRGHPQPEETAAPLPGLRGLAAVPMSHF